MINKIYKTINNKYYRFFKFLFFLRYLFAIFFVSILLFLLIPQFFDYKKKEKIIKSYLFQNYGLNIKNIEKIEYNPLPAPNLQLNILDSNFRSKDLNLKIQKLTIYPKLLSIYNFQRFDTRKIKLENNYIEADLEKINSLLKHFLNLEKKIYLKNLNLRLKSKQDDIINIYGINFLNYGYKKNIIQGEIFNKRFKINFRNQKRDIKFKLVETGISASLNIEEKSNTSYKGNLKGKILKSKYKLNFIHDENSLKIYDFSFRDKDLSIDSDGLLKFKPFFKINIKSKINSIEISKLKKLDLDKILHFNDLIKRLNSEVNIFFKPKRFSRGLIDELNINTKLAYGNLIVSKKFFISNSIFTCKNNVNLLEEYPVLFFDCSIISPDKKKLLKKIDIKYKKKHEPVDLAVKGNLNILNKKINFESIEMNENYKATDEDLSYFKNTFENIIFDEDFLDIFNSSKIKKFIYEIS